MPYKLNDTEIFEYGIGVFKNPVPIMEVKEFKEITEAEYNELMNFEPLKNKSYGYKHQSKRNRNKKGK